MTDWFIVSLGVFVSTLTLLVLLIVTYLGMRRQQRAYVEERARLPEACRLITLREDVERLEEQRPQLEQVADEGRKLAYRGQLARQWLEANEEKYERQHRELPSLSAQVELAEVNRDSAIQERDVAKTECDQLHADYRELQQNLAPAQLMLERKKEAQDWLQANLATYERASRELPTVLDELSAADMRIEATEDAITEAEQRKDLLYQQHRELFEAMAPAQLVINQRQEAEAWLGENLPICESLMRELPSVRNELVTEQRELATAIELRDAAIARRDELQREHREIIAAMAPAQLVLEQRRDAETWLDENRSAYELVKRELPQTREALDSAQCDLAMATQLRDAAIARRDELQREHREIIAAMAPAQLILEQRRAAETWLSTNGGIYETSKKELPQLLASIETTRTTLSKVESDTRTARAEFAEIVHNLAQHQAEDQALQGTRDRLEELCTRLESQKQQLTREVGELQARLTGLLTEAEQARVHRAAAQEELAQSRSELDDVRRELSKRREEMTELESERATKLEVAQMLDRLVKKLEADKKQVEDELERSKLRLQRELDQINSLIAAAVKRWGDVGPTVGANDTNRLAELWTPVLKKADLKAAFKPKSSDSERESLERTSQHLLHQGLRFDRRVLNAFHTSLKVAEMSPLVVLAGISGTGKSELPRRYAEGMGMHSLTLAVQPRWDSPQDMFGFYNYLESRYRATELARALVQMDRFAKERKTDWNYPDDWLTESLSDRMLLVLLDEMNLARVEYYFSEFLSKLETRRGIDRNNATERRKAEIMLEVGLSSMRRKDGAFEITQQPTLPMFVDRNVLFVGTMNEDETTQTLSDKVVDRANVLRFGRPKKLGAETNGTQTKPTEAWLPYTTWIGWVRDEDTFNGSVRAECEGWIHELNQAMQSIGRPFAHRTYGAMLSYVANYPEQNQHKLAMADQIELKLLPKFRGLDPSEQVVRSALSTLQSVIGKLGDEKLANAVREASKASEHQFVWHGVDRMDES